ncbi:MAG: 5'/3'-nucleotidase SurE [Dehalococcoidia bacterium]|nr:5'/3'-nucleotidase SurE [Dehalococcoidia bacterium]
MILVSNDDGIFAPGLHALSQALSSVQQVVVSAPDREQSATGTSVTLRVPLRVRAADAIVTGADTYAVEGSPGDSVILGLDKLAPQASMVFSGVNSGQNLGDDVLISGTVGAALQGYLRGLPSVAVSAEAMQLCNLPVAGKLAALLGRHIACGRLPRDLFLNVNLPPEPFEQMRGIKLTTLSHKTHIDTAQEGTDGRREYYWLVQRKLEREYAEGSDLWAIEHAFISITPLHTALFGCPDKGIDEALCAELWAELSAAFDKSPA